MKATVEWLNDAMFSAQSETGHRVLIDGPPDQGGKNQGPRPMELVLLGLGGCTSFDVVSILKKSRQAVRNCRTEISAERADGIPSVFTNIHIHFIVEGENLKVAQVSRAIRLSAEKYCSASLMLERGGVDITHDFEIVQPAAKGDQAL